MSSKKTCPVCGWELKEDAKTVTVGSHSLTVCCDECVTKVKAEPSKYAVVK